MTTLGGCLQKTYYHVPNSLQSVSKEPGITVYPNPANSFISVLITGTANGNLQLDVLNALGQKINSVVTVDSKATIDVSILPAGLYLINCYNDGIKMATSRFIKN